MRALKTYRRVLEEELKRKKAVKEEILKRIEQVEGEIERLGLAYAGERGKVYGDVCLAGFKQEFLKNLIAERERLKEVLHGLEMKVEEINREIAELNGKIEAIGKFLNRLKREKYIREQISYDRSSHEVFVSRGFYDPAEC